jgi:hypothetical protein
MIGPNWLSRMIGHFHRAMNLGPVPACLTGHSDAGPEETLKEGSHHARV